MMCDWKNATNNNNKKHIFYKWVLVCSLLFLPVDLQRRSLMENKKKRPLRITLKKSAFLKAYLYYKRTYAANLPSMQLLLFCFASVTQRTCYNNARPEECSRSSYLACSFEKQVASVRLSPGHHMFTIVSTQLSDSIAGSSPLQTHVNPIAFVERASSLPQQLRFNKATLSRRVRLRKRQQLNRSSTFLFLFVFFFVFFDFSGLQSFYRTLDCRRPFFCSALVPEILLRASPMLHPVVLLDTGSCFPFSSIYFLENPPKVRLSICICPVPDCHLLTLAVFPIKERGQLESSKTLRERGRPKRGSKLWGSKG